MPVKPHRIPSTTGVKLKTEMDPSLQFRTDLENQKNPTPLCCIFVYSVK